MRIAITLINIFICVHLPGQNRAYSTTNSDLKEFRAFLNNFCNEESDILLKHNDPLMYYRVAFTSTGCFIDSKTNLARLYNIKNLKKEKYSAKIVLLEKVQDSLRSYFRRNSCQPIKTCIFNNCFGEPLADSMVNIYSEPSFWASCISAKEIKFSQEIPISKLSNNVIHTIKDKSVFASPSIISYLNGKYLVIDIMIVLGIGNQTDTGESMTFFLEQIE